MQAVLHIGAPKTGTSALQFFLKENRRALARHGYYYPWHRLDRNRVSGGHASLGTALLKGDHAHARHLVRKWLRAAHRRDATLLLSAESLYDQYDAIAELFADTDTWIIAYFRDPIEALISNHNQVVKRHSAKVTLEQYLREQLQRTRDNVSGQTLFRWLERFPRERLRVLPYWADHFPGGRIEYSFLQSLGIDPAHRNAFALPKRRINTSYTNAALEMKRLLNHVIDRSEAKLLKDIDLVLQDLSDHTPPGDAKRAVVAPATHAALEEVFRPSNDAIKAELLRDVPPGFLDASDPPEGLCIGDSTIPRDALAEVYEHLTDAVPELDRKVRENTMQAFQNGEATPEALPGLAGLISHFAPSRIPTVQVRYCMPIKECADRFLWYMDRPEAGAPLSLDGRMRTRLAGWVAGFRRQQPELEVVQGKHSTIYRPAVDRDDVVQVIQELAGYEHTEARCGFDLEIDLSSPVTVFVRIGEERQQVARLEASG